MLRRAARAVTRASYLLEPSRQIVCGRLCPRVRTSSSNSSNEPGVEVGLRPPGVHNLALWEALRSSSIRLVGVRHEQAAAYAADGYARATGRLGVALTTTGPGAANTLGAVGEAWASRSPILVIATDIPSSLRWHGRVPRRAARDRPARPRCSRPWSSRLHLGPGPGGRRVAAVAAIASAVARAHAPRLPRDRDRPARGRGPGGGARPRTPSPLPAPEFGAAIERLDAAERPLLWVGGGARDAAARDRRAGREARGAGDHHLWRGRRPAAGTPLPGRPPAPRRGRRAAVGRGRRRAGDRLGPRRRADAELRPAAAGDAHRGLTPGAGQLPRGRAVDRRRGRRRPAR